MRPWPFPRRLASNRIVKSPVICQSRPGREFGSLLVIETILEWADSQLSLVTTVKLTSRSLLLGGHKMLGFAESVEITGASASATVTLNSQVALWPDAFV